MNETRIAQLSYINTLPIHPPPERLESLSSYIMRIVEANGYDEIRTLYKLMGIFLNKASEFKDYPHQSFGTVALRTACSEPQLLATTLYYAGKKFGRSAQGNALSRFFQGSLGEYLRYCPLCLSLSAYYPLTWRFLVLTGCHLHHCRLLDRCGHCGQRIPLFTIPAKMGVCPHCNTALHQCPTEMLVQHELEVVQQRATDLEYLVTPQGWEEGEEIARTMGWRFKKIREERQYSIEQVVDGLAETVKVVRHLERGTKEIRLSFQLYLTYADYLHTNLQTIFTHTSQPPPKHRPKAGSQPVRFSLSTIRYAVSQLNEADLLKQVQKVIQDHRDLRAPFNLRTVCKEVHKSLSTLKRYPSIKAFLEQVSDELRQERREKRLQFEDEVFEQVQQAIHDLSRLGQVLSEKAICEYVHRKSEQLRRIPRVNALLKQLLGKARTLQGQLGGSDEELIFERVRQAISDLRASGKPITQEKISRTVGLSLQTLKRNPKIKDMLEQVARTELLHRREQSQRHCREIVERVQRAIEQLQSSGQALSRNAVAELVGMSVDALGQYAPVRTLMFEVGAEHWFNGPQRMQQRETELIEQVRQAMEYLQKNGKRITQRAVGALVAFSDAGLTYYPGFRQFYYQVIEERRRTLKQLAQQREDFLLERIHETIRQLQDQKEALTLSKIADMVGMRLNSLRKYPRIEALFRHLREDKKSKRGAKRSP